MLTPVRVSPKCEKIGDLLAELSRLSCRIDATKYRFKPRIRLNSVQLSSDSVGLTYLAKYVDDGDGNQGYEEVRCGH